MSASTHESSPPVGVETNDGEFASSETYQHCEDLFSELDPSAAHPIFGWEVDGKSPMAEEFVGLIKQAGVDHPIDHETAPFRDHADNTDEAWRWIPDEAIRDFLKAKPFVDTSWVGSEAGRHNLPVCIRAEQGETIGVPSDLIVNAAGFDSWQGRGLQGQGAKKGYSKFGNWSGASLDTIKHYAALDSELPPVDELQAFIQPDGTVFVDNASGDSHRLAAAMLRGDTEVRAKRLRIQMLETNFITAASETS